MQKKTQILLRRVKKDRRKPKQFSVWGSTTRLGGRDPDQIYDHNPAGSIPECLQISHCTLYTAIGIAAHAVLNHRLRRRVVCVAVSPFLSQLHVATCADSALLGADTVAAWFCGALNKNFAHICIYSADSPAVPGSRINW